MWKMINVLGGGSQALFIGSLIGVNNIKKNNVNVSIVFTETVAQ